MDNFYWLHQIQAADQEIVGNQAFHLSTLIQHNHPVIPGIVIPAPIFWAFLETINWLEPFFVDLSASSLYLDSHDAQNLQRIAQGIRHQILTSTIPSEWLSRFTEILKQWSAPALTFQGYLIGFESNSTGIVDPVWTWANPTAMAEGLKQTWAEFFRARSLFYWDHRGLALQQLKPTILVQPLYQPIASGVIQIDPDSWRIQAVPGLNFSIGSGETEPDYYHLHPQTHQIQSQKLGDKTIAYQLKSTPRATSPEAEAIILPQTIPLPSHFATAPLQASILSEDQQTAWALEPDQLQRLIQLAQHVLAKPARAKLPEINQLHWLLCSPSALAGNQFYWTACYTCHQPSIHSLTPLIDSTPPISSVQPITSQHRLLSGLGVAMGQAIATACVISSPLPSQDQFPTGAILVTAQITADYFPLLKQAAGFVAEQGGMTGHGAILARELGIPAVVGVHQATQQIQAGETLFIDGRQGEVHLLGKDTSVVMPATDLDPSPQLFLQGMSVPIATHLMVNISQPSSIDRLHHLPIDGIGLLRSELLALDVLSADPQTGLWNFQQWLQPSLQSEFVQRMAEGLCPFAAALSPKPIFYRALDLREFYSEARPFWGETTWEYLILRQRIHRQSSPLHQESITLFDLELAVLAQLHRWGYSNIKLILPFVRSVEEFSVYYHWVKQAGLTENPLFQFWIMAEVPSVLFLLSDYVKAGVEGIAIGTNDLTQLLFGIERNNNEISPHLNASHPAVTTAVQKLIQMARKEGIYCSLCGDAPVLYPHLIPQLIQWGIHSISVQLDAVESTYQEIVRAEKLVILEGIRHQLEMDENHD